MKKTLLISLFCGLFISLFAQWTPQGINALPSFFQVKSIHIVDKNVVWAVADSFIQDFPIPASHSPRLLRTTNGGTTWRTTAMTNHAGKMCLDIHAFDSLTAYTLSSFASPRQLQKTVDGGLTWQTLVNNLPLGGYLHFWDAQNAILLSGAGCIRTTDGWATSTSVDYSNSVGQFGLFSGASGSNAYTVIGDSIWMASEGRIIFSPYRGVLWRVQSLDNLTGFGGNTIIPSVAFKDARNGMALGFDLVTEVRSLAKTSNGGATWELVTTFPSTIGTEIEYVPNTKGTYVVGDFTGLKAAMYTVNSGQTWVQGDVIPLLATRFLNPQTGWAGTSFSQPNNPAFYKWNGGNTLTKTIEPEAISLTLSPNPTARYLTINHATDFQPTDLSIYDLKGRLVFTKKMGGSTTQTIDLEGLNNGIYLVQLRNTEGVAAAQKIVIQK